MGFFRKIGKGLKRITKSISLKNAKNLATGNVGGVLKDVEGKFKKGFSQPPKKMQKPAENLALQNDAELLAQAMRTNPNVKDILTGALGGALTGAGTVLTESQTVQEQGAKAVDNIATAWLKKNWLKLVGGITAGTLLIWGIVRFLKPKTHGRR